MAVSKLNQGGFLGMNDEIKTTQGSMRSTPMAQSPIPARSAGNPLNPNQQLMAAARERAAIEARYAPTGDYDAMMAELRQKYPGVKFGHTKSRFEKARMKYMGGQLRKEANDFEQNMGNLADQQFGLLKDDVEANLNQGLDKTRENYSNRGLLFSGFRQGAESNQRGQAASMLAEGRTNINRDVRQQADAKKNVAASFGLQTYQAAVQNATELSNIQMQNALNRRRAAGQLGQGIGYAVGAYYGSQAPAESPAIAQRPSVLMPDMDSDPSMYAMR